MVVRMGSIPVGRISMETVQRGTLSHTTQGKVLNTHVHLMTPNTQTPLFIQQVCNGNTQTLTQPHGS